MEFQRVGKRWVRVEQGEEGSHSVFVAHRGDESAKRRGYNAELGTGYDSRCGWCWLNATHSEAAHEVAVKEAH